MSTDRRILQGTTPILACHFKPEKLDVSNIAGIELAMAQEPKVPGRCGLLMVKKTSDCIIDTEANTISYHFNQEETLNMVPKIPLQFQFRFHIGDEYVGTLPCSVEIVELLSHRVFEL